MARRSTLGGWETVINLAIEGMNPPEIQRQHAAFARQKLAEHLAGVQSRPAVTVIVDGRRDASEDSVKPYGVIRYEFSYFREVAAEALAQAQEMSPVRSGRYKRSWFVLADGVEVAPDAIPDKARSVMVVNDQPYHRKIHVGAMRNLSVPPLIVERLRQVVQRRFGNLVQVGVRFILLEGGYILKGRNKSRRKDLRAGQPMTYPALELTLR